jgi:hypothetical protein
MRKSRVLEMPEPINHEFLFDATFKRRGGLWRLEDIDPEGKGIAADLIEIWRVLVPDVYFGFINNSAFNAVATVVSGRDLIGINVGAFELIHNAFFNLLSRRDCLMSIGDPSVERENPGPANLAEPVDSKPIDPARTRAALDLAFCACLILCYHELMHIELCHIPFLAERLGVTELCEMQATPIPKNHVWLYRTLENDADISGAVSSARVWKFWYSQMNTTHLDPMGWDRTWIAAAHMLYWVMEFLHPPRQDGAALTHPAPYFRMVSVMSAVSKYGGIPKQLTDEQLKHDTLVPWIASQCSTLNRPLEAVTEEAIEKQMNALSTQYRRIAHRLEELQDARSERTGRKIDRPGYPGTGWARRWQSEN